jgi:hypothetical protein
MTAHWPLIVSACADCGVGTISLGEWYMVRDDVWEQAWRGRRKWWHSIEGQEVLCIGCLERRLGRTLVAGDFIPDVPANDPNKSNMSERLRERLMAHDSRRRRGRPKGSKNKPKPTMEVDRTIAV